MLLTIKRETLLNPLLQVTGFIDKKHTMPILSNVYLEKIGDKLTVIGNDMEIQASVVSFSDEMDGEDFTITLPGKKLQDILKVFPENSEIKFEIEENKVVIKSGRAKFTVQTLGVEHYPLLKISDTNICEFNLSQKTLKSLISQIQYAMAEKDSRVFLNGMLLEVKNNILNLVATDAHRLSFTSHGFDEEVSNCTAIIPKKSILELYRLLEDNDENVAINIYQNQISFNMPHKELITKIIDGKYPDYERVIPLNNDKLCLINREELLKAVDRVSVIGIDKLRAIQITIENNQLLLSCTNEEQEESQDQLEITAPDNINLKLNFNLSYLRDLLNNASVPELQFAFYDEQRSVLATIPNDTSFKAVLMPLRS
jgi:DNA polymerase III subunit beta